MIVMILALIEAVIIFILIVMVKNKEADLKVMDGMVRTMDLAIDGQEKDLLEYERRIEQFEKELRLYTTIIREHGLEVKE